MSVFENAEVAAVGLGAQSPQGHRPFTRNSRLGGTCRQNGAARWFATTSAGIARAMVAIPPAFVLLDEPAAGMSDAECEGLMVLDSIDPKGLQLRCSPYRTQPCGS